MVVNLIFFLVIRSSSRRNKAHKHDRTRCKCVKRAPVDTCLQSSSFLYDKVRRRTQNVLSDDWRCWCYQVFSFWGAAIFSNQILNFYAHRNDQNILVEINLIISASRETWDDMALTAPHIFLSRAKLSATGLHSLLLDQSETYRPIKSKLCMQTRISKSLYYSPVVTSQICLSNFARKLP